MTPAEAHAALAARRRELRRYHADTPPPDDDIGDCPVCNSAVFTDYAAARTGSRWAPVDMPDGGVTHEGCKHRYWQAVEELDRAQTFVPSLDDLLDADDDRDWALLATSTSAQTEYVEARR